MNAANDVPAPDEADEHLPFFGIEAVQCFEEEARNVRVLSPTAVHGVTLQLLDVYQSNIGCQLRI